MPYLLEIKEDALKDALSAYNYYEEASPGLGEKFLKQLQIAYTSISLYPTNFGFIDNKKILRDRLLKIFPYSVVYKIEDNRVIIIAIHNCYQHPGKKYRNR